MSDEKKKRQRGPNYTVHEKELIIALANEKMEIIENKKIDGATNRLKEEAWEEIATQFNAACPAGQFRTPYSIQKWYINKKKEVAKLDSCHQNDSAPEGILTNVTCYPNVDLTLLEVGDDDNYDDEDDGSSTTNNPPIKMEETNVSNLRKCRRKVSPTTSSPGRWRPLSPATSFYSKQTARIYENIARTKLEMVKLQKAHCQAEHRERMEEIKLRQMALQYDISIKKAQLQKINSGASTLVFN